MTKLPTVEEMLKAGMHFGHRTSKWHPKMEPFIFGARNGVHIIDLVKSKTYLIKALDYMKQAASEDKVILFVGTKSQVKHPMKEMALEVGMPYITEKWMGGLLTNFPVVKKLIKKFKDLNEEKANGKLEKYTKKEQLNFARETVKLETKVGGLVNMTKLPDVVFVWDIREEKNAVLEAKKKNIPVVAICDTNVNPKDVNYIIPSNDDATKTIKMLLNVIKETLLEGKASKKVE
ncbi:MAG: 30S ribosomal protein S2 [Patescibacteria group bacterium]|jgi:small subunit ribosomal protein S2|nr:30S ribosomal protein S2 [Patescibacteria group bacterium]